MFRTLITAGLLLASGAAFAQDDETDADSGRKIKYQERTEIDFEAVDVAGELVKPQGSLLVEHKRASFNPLIRLRTDFNDEMNQSINEVR
jgi:hypothetical protein